MEKEDYPKAWTTFRKFSGETDILIDCVRRAVASLSFKEDWQLIDIGTGDGVLLSEILRQNVFVRPPAQVTLVEPSERLLQRAKTAISSHSSLRIKYEFVKGTLPNVAESVMCYPSGLILAIHSSYYFSQADLKRLAWLRHRGFRVLIIENDAECWVSCLMKEVGNSKHPQFDHSRFNALIGNLGQDTHMEIENHPARLSRLCFWYIPALWRFFTFQQELGAPGLRTFSWKLIKGYYFRPCFFSYRCIRVGW